MAEIKNAQSVTQESFMPFARDSLGRELTEREEKGLKRLTERYAPADVEGYFLGILAKAQAAEVSLDAYVTGPRKSLHQIISLQISRDEAGIRRADRNDRYRAMDEEFRRKSPDLFD